ncbi:IclR family transcriptional regulator [Pseudonocardia acaciae]|uniref:IclR family transcriptional regulator n=1 Tax=Pseudonocardia acaciae TaxID=551276 RepID=UPI0005637813|nr:IclR family transcriptional regulator [Pseudonocardia acaciae]
MAAGTNTKPGEIAQTLDRGLRVLEALAEAGTGMTTTDVAEALGIHRSIAARLLATLVNRSYVSRDRDGRYALGTALLTLARQVAGDLLQVATPLMSEAAERLGLTVVLHVADQDEAVAVASIEPRNATFRLGVRPGTRHPLRVAASGLAILSGREPVPGERPEVTAGRARGYVVTTGELVPNFTGVEAPVFVNGRAEASIGLIVPAEHEHDDAMLSREVVALAGRINASLR